MLLPCLNRLSNVGAPPATILGKRRSAKHQASADSFSTGGAKGRSVRTQSGENSNHKSEWKPNGFNGRSDLLFRIEKPPAPPTCKVGPSVSGSTLKQNTRNRFPMCAQLCMQVWGEGIWTWKNKPLLRYSVRGHSSIHNE